MSKCFERLYNGIIKENPTLVLMLGMCPTLAVTTSAYNGLGMGLTTTAVLALSNVIISMLRKVIPNKIRIPAFIVIIASFVTIMQLLLQAYLPSLYSSLGIYIPLIVVNCIILGRAEAYAYKNPVHLSFFDGLGMGLGFTLSLTLIGLIREFIGACTVFDIELGWFTPIGIFKMAPGAFFVLALLTAIQNKVKIAGAKKGKDVSKIQSGCGHDCLNCNVEGCRDRKAEMEDIFADMEEKAETKAEKKTEKKTETKTETKAEKETAEESVEEPAEEIKQEEKTEEIQDKPKKKRGRPKKVEGASEEKNVEVSESKPESKPDAKAEATPETKPGGEQKKKSSKAKKDQPSYFEEKTKDENEFDEVFDKLTFEEKITANDDSDFLELEDLELEEIKKNSVPKKKRGKKGGK